MSDIVERLTDIYEGDHERGCQGRCYQCTCDYDAHTFETAEAATTEITALRAQVAALTARVEDGPEFEAMVERAILGWYGEKSWGQIKRFGPDSQLAHIREDARRALRAALTPSPDTGETP